MNTQPPNAENCEESHPLDGHSDNEDSEWDDEAEYWRALAKRFEDPNYNRPAERTFTESETLKMLKALRQRCAEEAKRSPLQNYDCTIEKIDIKEFIK